MSRPLAYVTAAWSDDAIEAKDVAIKYCRDLYKEGYSPICPLLFQSDFLDDGDAQEHKDKLDMAEELLRRSRVVVACGPRMDEKVKSDIALAKRLGIVSTTMDGITKVGKKIK
ncbi:MAG: hypothetical protein UHN47_07760 [Lachnospiraceae bacterium]|nr:hypothetical protein [Lachnospiraceae bacterium]